jgi:hypothetical protein
MGGTRQNRWGFSWPWEIDGLGAWLASSWKIVHPDEVEDGWRFLGLERYCYRVPSGPVL